MAEVGINVRADTKDAQGKLESLGRKGADAFKKLDKEGTGAFTRLKVSAGNVITTLTSLKGLLVSYGAIRAFGALHREARDFETALVDLRKVTDEDLGAVKRRILDMDSTLGGSTELVKGYYQTLSAGVTDPAKAAGLLTTAAKASKSSHTDLSEVIKGLTKLMAGYEGEIKSADEAADLLFQTEKQGQTTFGELIPVIGGLAMISKDLGISSDELGGSLSLISQTAGSTDEAATRYRGLLVSLLKPTAELTAALDKMGFSSAETAIKQMGLKNTLERLKESTGGSSEKMAELFGSQEALLGFSALSAEGFKKLSEQIDGFTEKLGKANRAWTDWLDTGEASDDKLKASFSKLKIAGGEAITPVLDPLIQGTTYVLEGMAAKVNTAADGARKLSERAREAWDHIMGYNSELEKTVSVRKRINETLADRNSPAEKTDNRDYLAEVNKKLLENIESITGAYESLNIQSSGQFVEMADKAVAAFVRIKESGTATPGDILRAYQSASESIKEILDGLKPKEVKAPELGRQIDEIEAADKKGYQALREVREKHQAEWDAYWDSQKASQASSGDISAVEERLSKLKSAFEGISTNQTFSPTVEVKGVDTAITRVNQLGAALKAVADTPVVVHIKGEGSAVLPISEKIEDIKRMFGSLSDVSPDMTANFSAVSGGINDAVGAMTLLANLRKELAFEQGRQASFSGDNLMWWTPAGRLQQTSETAARITGLNQSIAEITSLMGTNSSRGGRGSQMNLGGVNIVINGANDPAATARAVKAELQKLESRL